MAGKQKIHNREIGQIRVYFKGHERHPDKRAGWRRFLPGPPLYRELICAAKLDGGILNATAHFTHYGYSGYGDLEQSHSETDNRHLPLCVELVGSRATLEGFCRTHGGLLKGKVILYKHLERWSFDAHGLKEKPASEKELGMPLE